MLKDTTHKDLNNSTVLGCCPIADLCDMVIKLSVQSKKEIDSPAEKLLQKDWLL
jgi:hypothetical protein